ncbi:ATPase AAA-type core [Penicillium malachiteum]|uniref:ATPase AAA-type core n=1 Tax=Penicillium malachiteum TaxID=1324776 RepID=UPI002546F131|nr:ATPase AAA-type core [Penicillium malachiteum]KAJ5725923.1 ATPase AAA-type core [Penicillium malachiteum]
MIQEVTDPQNKSEGSVPIVHSEKISDEVGGVGAAEPGDSSPVTEANSQTGTEEDKEEKLSSSERIARKEKVNAAASKEVKDQPHIVFVDPVGTRWLLPYGVAKTWDGAKMLLKSIFTDIYLPEWVAEDIDAKDEGPNPDFLITQTKPHDCRILTSHWDHLVSPGWEFKIQFTGVTDVTGAISREKENQMNKANGQDESDGSDQNSTSETSDSEEEELEPAVEMSSIIYIATYLEMDSDGDYLWQSRARSAEKTKLNGVFEIKKVNSVIEETREVYSSSRHDNKRRKNAGYDTIGKPVLQVNSPFLLNALKATIECQSRPDEFYPKQNSRGRTETDLGLGRLVYPFTDIYLHREKLVQYREKVGEVHDDEYTATCKEHIDILLEYIYDLPEIGLKDAELLFSSEIPKTTFGSLWLLLKPGSDVFVREYGIINAYVIESVSGGLFDSGSSRSSSYCVSVWNLKYRGGKFLTRSIKTVYIPVFEYEREISSLPLYPIQFHVNEDPENPLRQQLIERGKRFVRIAKNPTYQEYTGPSRMQGTRTFAQTRVVVDQSELEESDDYHEDELGSRTRKPLCPCATCKAKSPAQHGIDSRLFDDYDRIDLNSEDDIIDHQYLLCCSHAYAYVLKDRAWDSLLVTGMRDPKIDENIIDTLVMKPESNKSLIKAVCEIFGGGYTQAFSSDFVRGKGEGQILLLHGPPGTGKTLTAESVAEYTGRPLLSIAAADLGYEPVRLEENLLQFFRDAKKWNAIVLLDEADVYLETRSSNDLRRNSIVSVFLRALDYFQGILFLTTNRVGSFDEAFLSRIHVQIGYDPLDEESRQKIWDGYFQKLDSNHEEGGQKIEYSMSAKEYVEVKEDLRILQWNGREIRNAFQTAVALACFEAKSKKRTPKLTDKHLAQVVTMSHNFKSYLRSVHGADGDLAWAARVRNDKIKASEGKISNTQSTRI